MKHNKWLFRLTAISLSTALFLTSISFPAIAAETSDSSTDSIEVETTALNETNLYAEDTTAATTETENDSLSETQPINTIESDSEQHTITGLLHSPKMSVIYTCPIMISHPKQISLLNFHLH